MGGGPSHYVVTPTRVEVELRLSWALTILYLEHQKIIIFDLPTVYICLPVLNNIIKIQMV